MARKKKPPQPGGITQGVLVQKPKTTLFTSLLIVAFLALMVGCILLYLEQARYGGFGNISAS